MSSTQRQITGKDAITELKDIQRVSNSYDALCLNEAIHALQEKAGIQIKPGEIYYLIRDHRVEQRICETEFADGEIACDVFRTAYGAEYELKRRDVMKSMDAMSPFPNSMCSYELTYDHKQNGVVASPIKHKLPRHPYFMSEDDAYACILAIGEEKIRKYYLGIA